MNTKQPNKRQCKVITVQEKLAILRQLEAGCSRREVVAMFKCSQSTISRVLSGKEIIIKDAESNVHNKRENLLSYKELDRVLSQWAKEMKNSNATITARMAKQKAEELSLALGLELKPSSGWLYKWKERENIKFAKPTKVPDEILKAFLARREKILIIRRGNEEKAKKLSEEESNITNTEDKQERQEFVQNHDQGFNSLDCENKPRVKRDYIKRLPIVGSSGVILRNRKEKTFLTLLQKLEILERLKNGERRTDLISEYNLSSSAMSQIVTDEEKIIKLAAGGQNLHMKRIRGGIFKDGEAELNAWVRKKLEIGESLTRTKIKNKAKHIAERLNIDFKASTGWLEKWKARMNLDFNENQLLERKCPSKISQDFEQVQQNIKEEYMENEYSDELETNDEFIVNDMDSTDIDAKNVKDDYICDDIDSIGVEATDVKHELLTPQQFYMQTFRDDDQDLHISREKQKERRQENEEQMESLGEPDIKPFIGSSPNTSQTEEEDTAQQTLHEQVLNWLNQYHIAPGPASELLNILKPHLSSVTNNFFNPLPQNRNFF